MPVSASSDSLLKLSARRLVPKLRMMDSSMSSRSGGPPLRSRFPLVLLFERLTLGRHIHAAEAAATGGAVDVLSGLGFACEGELHALRILPRYSFIGRRGRTLAAV